MVVEEVKRVLKLFRNLKIAVVGDLILDKYVFGRVERISPEAPVPVFEIEGEEYRAGGAANVSLNLKSLGVGEVALLGRVGEDFEGEVLKEIVSSKGVKTFFVSSAGVPTTRKTRLVARSQQLIRIDRERRIPLGEGEAGKLLGFLREFKPDAVIVSDYAKGVFTKKLAEGLRALRIPTFADPRPKNTHLYRGFTAVTPNLKEFEEMKRTLRVEGKNFERSAEEVRKRLKLERLVVTLSERGIALVKPEGVETFPATAREVYDVTGAGDTVVATLTAVVAATGNWELACRLANAAAGVAVGKLGTATVSAEELLEAISQQP